MKKAAKKALRQAKKRRISNKKIKANLKYLTHKCERAIREKNKKQSQEFYKMVMKAVDKSAQKKIIKKNKASRIKSRLAKKINTL